VPASPISRSSRPRAPPLRVRRAPGQTDGGAAPPARSGGDRALAGDRASSDAQAGAAASRSRAPGSRPRAGENDDHARLAEYGAARTRISFRSRARSGTSTRPSPLSPSSIGATRRSSSRASRARDLGRYRSGFRPSVGLQARTTSRSATASPSGATGRPGELRALVGKIGRRASRAPAIQRGHPVGPSITTSPARSRAFHHAPRRSRTPISTSSFPTSSWSSTTSATGSPRGEQPPDRDPDQAYRKVGRAHRR
jgi:hypothetical protein